MIKPSKVLCGLRNPWRRRRAPGGGGGGGMFEVNVSAGGLPEVVERSRLTCLPEICWRSARSWRSAGGLPEVGGLLEVCQKLEVCRRSTRGWRSARGLPEVGRKCTKFESARSAGGRPEVCQVRGTEDHQLLLPTQEEKYYSHTVG